jgi:hypothetical protein
VIFRRLHCLSDRPSVCQPWASSLWGTDDVPYTQPHVLAYSHIHTTAVRMRRSYRYIYSHIRIFAHCGGVGTGGVWGCGGVRCAFQNCYEISFSSTGASVCCCCWTATASCCCLLPAAALGLPRFRHTLRSQQAPRPAAVAAEMLSLLVLGSLPYCTSRKPTVRLP